MAVQDLKLYTSLRYDPLLTSLPINTESWDEQLKEPSPFYILTHHRDRILQAADHFGWIKAVDAIRGSDGFVHLLKKLTETIDTKSPTPLRIRVLLSHDGSIGVESSPAAPVTETNLFPKRIPPPKASPQMKVSPLTAWDIIPDSVRTKPSPYTSYKTTNRDMYGAARERVGIKDMTEKREVLIVSEKDGEIMEGSLTSVFFWRNGKWTTPPVASGGQVGTTRRWALAKGFCVEGVVTADSLKDGEECWISNGVRGFQWGKVKLS
ncbi:aminotransferase [Hyaloscypha finlandica]|nr:aminotransferase [Hyaloscypha finlandica]